MSRCNCYDKAPTVPVYRDMFTHLSDCPAFGQHAVPVGGVQARADEAVTLVASDERKGDYIRGSMLGTIFGFGLGVCAVLALLSIGR